MFFHQFLVVAYTLLGSEHGAVADSEEPGAKQRTNQNEQKHP